MLDLHLIDFYKDAARALLILQGHFPRKIELYVADLIGDDHTDEFGLHSKRHLACLGAFLWLADEGFLRYQNTIRQEGIDQAILTNKALVLLSRIETTVPGTSPSQSEPQPESTAAPAPLTMADHMQTALQSQSSKRLTTVMQYFFAKSQINWVKGLIE